MSDNNIPINPGLPSVQRNIASAVLITSDGKVVMGRKNPDAGGVYPNAWHIPGGGIQEGESTQAAVDREVREETGLDIRGLDKTPLPVGHGAAVKTLANGQEVWCEMTFNRFEVRLPTSSDELSHMLKPGDDLVELRCFGKEELRTSEHIPAGKEFFQEMGYID